MFLYLGIREREREREREHIRDSQGEVRQYVNGNNLKLTCYKQVGQLATDDLLWSRRALFSSNNDCLSQEFGHECASKLTIE